MNAYAAFEHRKDALAAQLGQAQSVDQAVAACTMALEQTACELAQDEQDEHARQRQQAVMAIARRAPQLLRAAAARGELVIAEDGAQDAPGTRRRTAKRYAAIAGAALLAVLAAAELIGGRVGFAAAQLAGGVLLGLGLCAPAGASPDARWRARAAAVIDADAAVRQLAELCQAADVCVSDLSLIERDAGAARLSGTADEAMLDLLVSLMEARASGREDLAMRSLAQAEQYLRMLGVEVVPYSEESAQMFDLLPTLGEERTIRPALRKDGVLLRRGTAARRMAGRTEGGAGA